MNGYPGATATPSAAPSATPSSGGGSSPSPTPTKIDDAVVINYGTDTQPLTKDVTLEDPLDLSRGGKHGNVNVISTAKVELKKTIKVSDNAPGSSKAGGNITITSRKTKDDAIIVRDSSQLLSLLNAAAPGPGGTTRFTSSGRAACLKNSL